MKGSAEAGMTGCELSRGSPFTHSMSALSRRAHGIPTPRSSDTAVGAGVGAGVNERDAAMLGIGDRDRASSRAR